MRDASHGSCVFWLAVVVSTQLSTSLPAAVPQEPDKTEQPETVSAPALPIDGSLSLRYRYRNSDEDGSDQDLLGLLSMGIGDPLRHRFTVHVLAGANWDMDGETADNVFNGITDTYDHSVQAELYDAYLDVHRLDPLEVLRLGRQTLYETPVPVSMDGLRIETEELGSWRIQSGAYGGVSHHLYESSSEGDFVIGAFLGGQPWSKGRLRVDWLHAADDTLTTDHDDDLVGFRFWQGVSDHTRLRVGYTMLSGDSRDVDVNGTTYVESWDLQLQASYYELLKTQRSLALEFDPFFNSVFDYYPYYQFRGLVAKGFGEHFNVTSGIDLRRIKENDDEGQFNRDYERVYLTPLLMDVLVDGLSLSLSGDYWASDEGEDVVSWGADLSLKVDERVRTSIGTYYALYKHDLGDNRERERVRTYYINAEYRHESIRLQLGYEFEHDEFDDYHQLDVRMTWMF